MLSIHLGAELAAFLGWFVNADKAQFDILFALLHFGLGFVEVVFFRR